MPYIKSMICQGFKSFRNKTIIYFDKGFSAIVGANGSGKSNVLDAFVFALGELSGNKLRVKNVRDLICNGGSVEKSPSNFAQVDIIFDNSDGKIPIDSKAVIISRKIDSKGNGNYYINRRRTTRRDLQDLMDLCNLIPNSTNLILQGELFRIINMTNLERRILIDEISGIASYNEKKESAEKQLEKVEENISRITILLNEVSIQLTNLESEKNDALEYQRLDYEQKNTEKALLIAKINSIRTDIRKIEEKKLVINQEINEIEKNIINNRNLLSEINESLEIINKKIKNLESDELLELTKKINDLKTEKVKYETSKEHLNKEIDKLSQEIIESVNKKGNIQKEKQNLKQELIQFEKEKDIYHNSLTTKIQELDVLKKELEKIDSNYIEIQQQLSILREKISKDQETKNQLYSEMKVLENKQQNFENIKLNTQEKITKLKRELQNFKENLIQLNEKRKEHEKTGTITHNIINLESEKIKILNEIKRLQEIIEDRHIQLISLKSKIKTIKNFSQNRAVEAILKIKDTSIINGEIFGTISQLGKIDSKYDIALEVAGGAKLNYIIVDSQKTAKECIQYLKENKIGRASFIPLDKIKVNYPNFTINLNENVIGRAVDLIQFNSQFVKAFEFVFGKTIIVKDLETAIKLPISARKVTIKGDIVEVSHLMHGGSHKKRMGFSFKTIEESEIPVLEEDLNKLRNKENMLLSELKQIDMKITEYYKTRIQGNNSLNEITQQLNLFEERINEKEKELNSLESEIQKIDDENNQVKISFTENKKVLDGIIHQISDLKDQEKKLQEGIQNSKNIKIKNDIQILEEEKGHLTSNISELELKITKIKAKLEDFLENHIKEIEQTISKKEETIKINLSEIASIDGSLKSINSEIYTINEKILEENQILGQYIDEKNQLIKKITDLRIKIEEMKSSIHPKSLQVNTLENKMENLIEQLNEFKTEFGENFEHFFEKEENTIPQEIKQKISISQQKLDEIIKDCIEKKALLEPVNMRAIEKYDKIKNRYEDLIEKHDQVVNERQSILDFIEQIETEKKDVFMRTFYQINENFGTIFSKLSPNGEAKLELENHDDPFEGGLRIMARPGGKKWCQIRSISGGEKALTIIALILGIQQYVPSPYYILDEIDSNLDEINTILVAEMIKELSSKSQFILITHKEPTMERSDQLLGISITDGISQVVNINIREALAQIAE